MADLQTAKINHLNDNPSQLHMPADWGDLKANCELRGRIAKMIDDLMDYDRA
jgi:hypothetical protein